MALHEKRGRNGKGPMMFHHMAPGRGSGGPGPDAAGAQHSLPSNLNSTSGAGGGGLHQRNKTQIVGGIEAGGDSVFRSSIMSTDHIQRRNPANNQMPPANGASASIQQNPQLGAAIQQRFSAKAPGGQQAPKVYAR